MDQPNLSQNTILIVDDTPENLTMLTLMLTERGYRVRPALNGQMALHAIRKLPPDLILLDIIMPDMDGFEVCQQLKAEPATRDIPVLFMSALRETIDKMRAFALGAVDYITKPFNEEEVFARVKTHLTLRNLQKRLEEQNAELQDALTKIKTLKGLLPICANCKKIRDDRGYWNQIEAYIEQHSEALFSHGLCPECLEKLYADQEWYQKKT